MVGKSEIESYGKIAMLKFKEDELEILERDINDNLRKLRALDELDLKSVAPLYQVYNRCEVFREDRVENEPMLTKDEVLDNASDKEYGFFRVKNIME